MNSIKFNDIDTYKDWGLLLKPREISKPTPKTNYVDIPGGDGTLDLSEVVAGEIKYNDLTLTFEFHVIDDIYDWDRKVSEITNYLHGRNMKIVQSFDPDYYYYGRCSVDKFSSSKALGSIIIKCVVSPYKLKQNVTIVSREIDTVGKVSEENITLNDSKNLPYKKFNICGKSIQDGTPTSEAPAEIQSVGENGTVEIKQIGKNLLNIEEFINDLKNTFSIEETIYNNKNCYQISISKNTHYYNLSNIEENTQYTIQLNLANTLNDFYLMFVYTDGTKKTISQQQLINNLTKIVVTSDVNKTLQQIQISLYSTNKLYIEKDTLSLEKSIEETEYEPYKENIYVIPLSQPLRSLRNGVKDTIEEDGTHRRVGTVILDGSEEGWNKDPNTDNTNDYFYIKNIGIDINNIDSVICNRFEKGSMTSQGFWASTVFCITINKEYTGIVAEDTKEQRITKFKTWLQQNPIQVDYELAEEVIEPLTEEQQAVIDDIYNTGTFKGVTNISSLSPISPIFDIEYQKLADKIEIINDRMSVIPKITCEEDIIMTFNNNSFSLSAGSYEILDIQFKEGLNTVELNGTGTVTFEFHEGSL